VGLHTGRGRNDGTTSSQVFVRCRVGRRVSLPVVLSPLVRRLRRRHRAKGGVFAFAPTDFLIKENKKHVKIKNAYALEVEKCEKLSSELSTCHETIDNLRNENANLLAKVDSNVCNVSIPNLRNDNDDLLAKIEELNISLASLRNENEKLLAKAKDFDICNATISDLRSKNDILHAKVVELKSCKPSTSTLNTLLFALDVEMLILMLFMIIWY
jgi:predicted RNase H-like nuclease (RuvC/YqgF family)